MNPDWGQRVLTPAGELRLARAEIPVAARWGSTSLADGRRWPVAGPDGWDLDGALFLDCESTGLGTGAGVVAFLVGLARFVANTLVIEQWVLDDFDDEPALLAQVGAALGDARGLVTYNGRAFDWPLLQTRFVLGRRPPPDLLCHADLLHLSRRLWRHQLLSCSLTDVETNVLGVRRPADVPGSLIPALYGRYLDSRDPRILAPILQHNRHDLLALVALAGHLGQLAVATAPAGAASLDAARLADWLGDWPRAEELYREALARPLLAEESNRIRLHLAATYKRQGAWDEAAGLWQAAAATGGPLGVRAAEELAKYLEHRRHDPGAARPVVCGALVGLCPDDPRRPRLLHRLGRLDRRLARRT